MLSEDEVEYPGHSGRRLCGLPGLVARLLLVELTAARLEVHGVEGDPGRHVKPAALGETLLSAAPELVADPEYLKKMGAGVSQVTEQRAAKTSSDVQRKLEARCKP